MITDRAGRQTTFEYNSVRQLIKRTDPLGRVTLFQWCKCGALRRLADPMGRTTTWRHDIQGRLTCKEYADGSQVTYLYEDTTSRLRQRIDEALQVTQYNYNRDDTLSRISYTNAAVATAPVTFTYDANYNRVTSMTDGTGTTRYGYVPITPQPTLGAGQLATVDGPLPNATITYGYDELGRRISTDINGTGSSVTLDAAGRVTSETNALGTFTYTYDGDSFRETSQTCPNGQTTQRSYGGNLLDNNLQQITNQNGATPISEFLYGYDQARGLITSWSQQSDTQAPSVYSLGYDAADQLTSATVSQAATTTQTFGYTYDPAANRLSEQIGTTITNLSYNALNELTASDAAGSRRHDLPVGRRTPADNCDLGQPEHATDLRRLRAMHRNPPAHQRRRNIEPAVPVGRRPDPRGTRPGRHRLQTILPPRGDTGNRRHSRCLLLHPRSPRLDPRTHRQHRQHPGTLLLRPIRPAHTPDRGSGHRLRIRRDVLPGRTQPQYDEIPGLRPGYRTLALPGPAPRRGAKARPEPLRLRRQQPGKPD